MGFRMQQLGPPSTVLPEVRKHVSGGPDIHIPGWPQEGRLGDNRPELSPVMLEPALPASAWNRVVSTRHQFTNSHDLLLMPPWGHNRPNNLPQPLAVFCLVYVLEFPLRAPRGCDREDKRFCAGSPCSLLYTLSPGATFSFRWRKRECSLRLSYQLDQD